MEPVIDGIPEKTRFYMDPGHGWLAVPVARVAAAGVLRGMSRYSYHDHQTAMLYLEEDCDLARYAEATNLDMEAIQYECSDGDSFIRRLPHLDGNALADALGI